jgi:CPA1 family monovalent cation:H+ antiporter
LVLIAYTVAIVTLVVQGGSLPAIIRLTRVRGTPAQQQREEFAELVDHIRLKGAEYLDDPGLVVRDGVVPSPEVVERVRAESVLRSESAWEQSRATGAAPAVNEQYAMLRRDVLRRERAALVEARNRGSFSSAALARAQEELDLEEARLDHFGGSASH